MPGAYESFGRLNQKRRTRAALMAAARALVRQGVTPTVAQVAEEALVSRTTAYRYFPSQEALVAEAVLDELIQPDLAAVYAAAETAGSAEERLDAVVRADYALVTKHEAAFRATIRAMLAPGLGEQGAAPRRPGNRLRYLANALGPLHDRLGAAQLERLVAALAMCVGIESLIVTTDICGLPTAEAEAVKRWAAEALLRAALAQSAPAPAPPP